MSCKNGYVVASAAKQSSVKWDRLIEKHQPFKRRLCRHGDASGERTSPSQRHVFFDIKDEFMLLPFYAEAWAAPASSAPRSMHHEWNALR
jgi:hypothetical protein